MSNLFITYEIDNENQDYEQLRKVINTLGNMTPIMSNCWYVNSRVSLDEAIKRVGSAILKDAKLLIVDTSNNACQWIGLDEKEAVRIRQNWGMDISESNQETVN